MKRITVEDALRVKEFAAKHGFTIFSGKWIDLPPATGTPDGETPDGGSYCCPLTALCAEATNKSPKLWWDEQAGARSVGLMSIIPRKTLGLKIEYIEGFIFGFDGEPFYPDAEPRGTGYTDGAAVRKALLP